MGVRHLLIFSLSIFVLMFFPSLSFANHESPAVFIKSVVDQFLDILKSKNDKDVQKKEILNLMAASFDFPDITEALLRGLKVKNNEKLIFTNLFPMLLQKRYGIFIKSPDSLVVEYGRYEVLAGGTKAVVYTHTKIPSYDMALNYKLHHADGKWKIKDITVDGISLVDNYKTQIHRIATHKSFSNFLLDLEKIVR